MSMVTINPRIRP